MFKHLSNEWIDLLCDNWIWDRWKGEREKKKKKKKKMNGPAQHFQLTRLGRIYFLPLFTFLTSQPTSNFNNTFP